MDIKSPFGKNQKGEVGLEFLTTSSPNLPCVIPQLDWGISIGNSRIFVIASEAKQSHHIAVIASEVKQSLGILNLFLEF